MPLETVVQGLDVPSLWNSGDSDTSQWRIMGGQVSHLPCNLGRTEKLIRPEPHNRVIIHASNNLEFFVTVT